MFSHSAPLVGDSKPLPPSLMEPIAIARRLCADEVKKVAPAPAPTSAQDDKTAGPKADQTKTDASTVVSLIYCLELLGIHPDL